MQKQVSKQSLAIVALSIILAISMALTATFAAFAQSATVSGTIQFSKGIILQFTNNEGTPSTTIVSDNANSFTITTNLQYEVAGTQGTQGSTIFSQVADTDSETEGNQPQVSPKIKLAVGSQNATITIVVTIAALGCAATVAAGGVNGDYSLVPQTTSSYTATKTFTNQSVSDNAIDLFDLIGDITVSDQNLASFVTSGTVGVTFEVSAAAVSA